MYPGHHGWVFTFPQTISPILKPFIHLPIGAGRRAKAISTGTGAWGVTASLKTCTDRPIPETTDEEPSPAALDTVTLAAPTSASASPEDRSSTPPADAATGPIPGVALDGSEPEPPRRRGVPSETLANFCWLSSPGKDPPAAPVSGFLSPRDLLPMGNIAGTARRPPKPEKSYDERRQREPEQPLGGPGSHTKPSKREGGVSVSGAGGAYK